MDVDSFCLEPQIIFNPELPENTNQDAADEDVDYPSGFTSLRGALEAENQYRAGFGPGYDEVDLDHQHQEQLEEDMTPCNKINLCVPIINTETLQNYELTQEITFRDSTNVATTVSGR